MYPNRKRLYELFFFIESEISKFNSCWMGIDAFDLQFFLYILILDYNFLQLHLVVIRYSLYVSISIINSFLNSYSLFMNELEVFY